MTDIVYSFRDSRIRGCKLEGLESVNGGRLAISPGTDYHMIITTAINGDEMDAQWGRLHFELSIPSDMVVVTHILASNEFILPEEIGNKNAFVSMGAKRLVQQNDILMYDVKGQYLYICIELIGEGEGYISNIRVDRVGDNFMATFPDIYRERDSFFHRYMSIYSSIYNDFEEEIRNLPDILNLDTCPAHLLVTYGHWLGVDLECDIRDENVLRTLVKEAYELNKMKGTKACVQRIAQIMLGMDITILEKNIMEQFQDQSSLEEFKILFGNNVYNVCILVNKKLSETLKSQFMYILRQFVPVRARVTIINLEKEGELDYHSYLDLNAKLFESREASLDNEMALDHVATLV